MTIFDTADSSIDIARIPLCHSEIDTDYISFLTSVFEIHSDYETYLNQYYLPNNCPLNDDPGNTPYYCDSGTEDQCPSIVLNEVYNSLDGVDSKECAFIAKEGDNGECYTVHDDEIRAYLSESTNGCLTVGAAESNGIISVATLRSSLTCSSLDLSDIVSYSSNISDVTELTTLQGLEYATSLTSLTLDGYDLSGDSNSNAEYDQLVVQILAKAVDYTVTEGTVDSGLTSLSVSGCGLTEVSDILDLTPIVSEDAATQPFKLTTLDISDNAISDVSVLITEDIFPADTLATLDISGNNICDIDGMVSELQAKFTALSSVTYSDQTCHCSASVSSADHQVCREVYPGRWAVECWHGYYLDKASGSCVAACASGYVYDTASATCVSSSSAVDDAIRCQVCEGHSTMMPVLEEGNSSITCGCRTGWSGDDCDSYEFQLYIPDDNFRTSVCEAADYAEGTLCDISDQTCHCSASVSSADHQVCREVYPGRWAVECWHGYYLDKASGSCVAACASGYVYDTASATCVSSSSAVDDAIRCQVCEGHSTMMPVLEEGNSSITCGCRTGWSGDDCDSYEFQLYIPDDNFRTSVCEAADYAEGTLCDISEFEMAGIDQILVYETSFSSLEGSECLINTTYFLIKNTDISSDVPFSCLNQITQLYFQHTDDTYDVDIDDINSIFGLNRIVYFAIYGNSNVYDISVLYMSISMVGYMIANTDYSVSIIPLCRSESDDDYMSFISSIFPIHNTTTTYKDKYYLPNSCPLNDDPGNTPYYCDSGTEDQCPSIVLNEVYNSLDGVDSKECAFIAKEGDNGECYTVHDDEIRAFLSDFCVSSNNIESNGVISVASMRSALKCSLISLSDIVSSSLIISDLSEISTLQGLEYASSLISLNINGYDLSGGTNSNAEYDKLVIQILAKAASYTNDYGSVDSGLIYLYASRCGLTEVSDILDLTPIASGDPITQPFKLTTLDLSDNSISDVSVLITEDIFPAGILTTLDISGNNICDIDGMVSELQAKFTALSSVTYSDQTCHCSASVSSADHQVCREVYPGRWAVECWHGYYLDKASGSCVAACASGYVYDTASATCVSSSSAVDDAIRCQVCEGHSTMMPVLEEGNSSITCGCRSAWYGDDCDQLYELYIPDETFRVSLCETAGYSEGKLCDISEFEMGAITTDFNETNLEISSFEGAQYLINMHHFSIENSDVVSVEYFSSLVQIGELGFYLSSDSYSMDIDDLNSLYTLSRLYSLSIFGNPRIYDISVTYRNIQLILVYIAESSYDISVIPLCRSESDEDYMLFLTSIFPIFRDAETYQAANYLPNSCPLNAVAGEYYCDPGTEDQCPSIVLNEVYNSLDGVDSKECAFIAKEGDNGECYTVHDDEIRAYLSDADNGFLTSDDIESNGIISVATLRSSLTSVILKLSDIVTYSSNLFDVNEITTLQGLEYASSLTSLNIDGYDLSEDTNSNAEYDKLVVQILAKAVSYTSGYGSIDSGLTSLSVSGCGLSEVSDVLDLTPIVSGDPATQEFKLLSLDLSNNSISDVSVFITEDIIPADTLTTLDISGNNICDIDGMVDELENYFSAISITYSDQTCNCTMRITSASHEVCREVYPGRWDVECWKGYYYDVATESCVEATATEDILRCQVCERNSETRPVLESGASAITCGCRSAWYGDDCESLYQVHVPSLWLRKGMCYYLGYELTLCDFSEFEAAGYSGSISNSDGFAPVTTPEGLHYMINVSDVTLFNISPVSALEFS
ncbi:Acidic leucine-rich nuclear phosphoprotein 32 like protein, partial [Aduncisulcus paluster]